MQAALYQVLDYYLSSCLSTVTASTTTMTTITMTNTTTTTTIHIPGPVRDQIHRPSVSKASRYYSACRPRLLSPCTLV